MSLSLWISIFILWNSFIFLPVTALLSTSTCSTKRSHQRHYHHHHHAFAHYHTRIRTFLQSDQQQQQLSDEEEEPASISNCFFPNAIPVTEEDRVIMRRQTGQIAPSVAALGVPCTCQCQYGYPQVFLLNPLVVSSVGDTTVRMNSGLLKLTCPLLVHAIDQMEDDGYIANFTAQVQSNEEWKKSCQTRHLIHANARKDILLRMRTKKSSLDDDDDPMSILQQKMGDRGAEAFLNSGIAGATVEKPDVKCLHAWMGDYLFFHSTAASTSTLEDRDSSNDNNNRRHYLGEAIAAVLQKERKIPLSGNPDCHQYCNPSHQSSSTTTTTAMSPPKPRNKQRLKTQKEKERRKRRKEKNGTGTELIIKNKP